MNQVILAYSSPGKLALVGASGKPKSFGKLALEELRQRGYELFPVNPTYATINGELCYRSIADLPDGIENAVFMLKPSLAVQAVAEAKARGIRRIWFQQGAQYDAAIESAKSAGIEVVSKKCILMYAGKVTGIHALHRFLNRLVGRY